MPTRTFETVRTLLADLDPDQQLAPCRMRELLLGPAAVAQVADLVEELLPTRVGVGRATVALLVDSTPILRRGEDVKALVRGQLEDRFDVRVTVLDDGHPELHVVDEVLDEAARAASGVDAVVALGGGTISDIGKMAAVAHGDAGQPVLVSVQTAASVDGYTDDVSVVLRDGVKRTVSSRWPDALVADQETIAEAPAAMNRAGFGEMTSMLVAPADWCLAGLVGTDHAFHEGPIRLLEVVGRGLEEWSPGVRDADPEAVAQLTRALALRGIATGVAGTTAVLSGVEHLVSHMLDQHHAVHHLPTGLHGAQVGVAAVIAAAAWEMLLERLEDATDRPTVSAAALDPDLARARVEAAFGGLGSGIAAECWQDYSRKLTAVRGSLPRLESVLDGWDEHAPTLRRLARPSAEIATALRAAGAPTSFHELDPTVSPELGRWAVESCALMRNRFTVVDLLSLLGWWEEPDVDEVLERAARATGAAIPAGRAV